MTDRTIEFMLGELTNGVKSIGEQVDKIQINMKDSEHKSDVSRANVHRRLDEYGDRTGHLEGAIKKLGGEVGEMKAVTDDVIALRQQAQGAGTLGHALLRVGGWVLASAGWAVGVYTYWTGRPPP